MTTATTYMSRNEGHVDRVLRVVVGLAILAAGLFTDSWWGLLGLVPLLTGLAGMCPLYRVIGFTTCGGEEC